MKLSTHLNSIILFFVVTLTACGDANSNKPGQTGTEEPQTLEEKLNDYIDNHLDSNGPGLSLLIAEGDEILYQADVGMADSSQGIAIDENTGFRLASVSKPFTAIAVMQLVEQGKLSVTSSIRTFIPELASSWQTITLVHLLTHTSGIPDFFTDTFVRNLGWEWFEHLDNQKVVDYFTQAPTLEFEPGVQSSYSNTNFVLLAEVISRATQQEFANYMTENLFAPFGLTNSYVKDASHASLQNEAKNYGLSHSLYNLSIHTVGSMGQVSSANDLFTLTKALLNQELITEESLSAMLQPHAYFDESEAYGYGWGIGEIDNGGGHYFFHRGSNDSFKTLLAIEPKTQLQFILLSNAGDGIELHIKAIFEMTSRHFGFE